MLIWVLLVCASGLFVKESMTFSKHTKVNYLLRFGLDTGKTEFTVKAKYTKSTKNSQENDEYSMLVLLDKD